MLAAVQGRDTLVRDKISKGRFVQGAQHPRIFGRGHIGRGHIGRGHINPASGEWEEGKGLPSELHPSEQEGEGLARF